MIALNVEHLKGGAFISPFIIFYFIFTFLFFPFYKDAAA